METLQWDILEKPVYSNGKKVENYKAILRNDNGNILNVAKKSYTPTPNSRFVEVTERLHEITGFPIENYFEPPSCVQLLPPRLKRSSRI